MIFFINIYYLKTVNVTQLSANYSELCGSSKFRCWGTSWESTWKLFYK